ncbi:YcaO-like family protein [Natrialba sp. PRR66]|uniref:YcaO-like family protein n=1 Tax=Natrialba sp. PRR66 TaxID=3098146 RepID=UPI002B1DCB54|nr:YcaO-like family protein [Natrialba sp. PRR66]
MRVIEHDRPLPAEYEWLLGRKTGIIKRLNVWYPERAGPQLLSSGIIETDTSTFQDSDGSSIEAGGKGKTIGETLQTVFGETVERYCMDMPDEARICHGSYNKMEREHEVIAFEYLDIYSDLDSTPYIHPIDKDTPIPWTKGVNLLTGETTYVPAELVWSFKGPLKKNKRHFIGTSNGAAAGRDARDAILSGLYELIERDGFMYTWLTHSSPQKIFPEQVDGLEDQLKEFLPSKHFECHIFEYDTLVDIPTYGAALVNKRDEYPKFMIGGAAGSNRYETIEDAVIEAAQGWILINKLKTERETDSIQLDDEIWNFEDNVLLYGEPEHFDKTEFLTDGMPGKPRHEPISGDTYNELLRRLETAGCTPICVEITTPETAHIGIPVVQTIVPELIPLQVPSAIPDGHPRLTDRELYEVPHPFP